MSFVSALEPQPIWRHFDAILEIPRPSTHEERAWRYVLEVAGRHGLRHRQDSTGNLVVEKPASPGREEAPIVVLQGHLDMVTEKNSETVHDFMRDPIVPRREDGWVKATGTTLGADNGIGAATMLAVMEAKDLVHGPLELLFTVDEESGLNGVLALDPAAIALAGRLLLNLDSEEEGSVTIGCAGGSASTLTLPLETAPAPAGTAALDVKLSGLKGGHSGMEIHLQRGNAVKLLARALFAAYGQTPFHLASFGGGNKHNALPREATARVVLPAAGQEAFTVAVTREVVVIQDEIRTVDPGLTIEMAEVPAPERIWTAAATRKVLDLLNALPHGVLAMSNDIPGLVETSVNLATAAASDGSLAVLTSLRSSVASAMRDTQRRLRAFADLAGGEVNENEGYPGWKPDLDSPLLATFRKLHRRLIGSDPELKAVHAGLECGVLGEKFPGMDMISFGPVIQGAHSPDERVEIASVGRFYKLLRETLAELAGGSQSS
ncbi:MAG TPA: aminoacyl-histidine dipeptidase [Thermoanaerobaculia bacterium]|jgi:dipeptidase D|nr:aminoacyl-histidine dipeptidase [Thermoanaerobaculia bacterium]